MRWCSVCKNGESVERTPAWKATVQTDIGFCPNGIERVFHRNYGAGRILRTRKG